MARIDKILLKDMQPTALLNHQASDVESFWVRFGGKVDELGT